MYDDKYGGQGLEKQIKEIEKIVEKYMEQGYFPSAVCSNF